MQFFHMLGLVAALATSVAGLPQDYKAGASRYFAQLEAATSTYVAVDTPGSTPAVTPVSPGPSASGVAFSASIVVSNPATATPSAVPGHRGSGKVTMENRLNFPLRVESASNVPGDPLTVPHGQNFTEYWRTNPNGGGISIKLSKEGEGKSVLQYEYTAHKPNPEDLYWDFSNIDLDESSELVAAGFRVTNSDPANCREFTCPPNCYTCAESYLKPFQKRSRYCAIDVDFYVTLGGIQPGKCPTSFTL
ncbi:hypothetical protein N7492_005899 [Penicillium capsulatum]|uniref:Uncharacterized protein n=1 Tax=Penicillium capsulatum TaxID=69766 RepID=A0A9W9LS42_9EURO|nr:hypothetical protein N7492_005899 [Penicillium capsulatum]KAJ6134999.1 hypothetical protein N7512_000159 [Penicillium capsulatum]